MAKRLALHPACKLFPGLNDAELQELADDIKANGLQNPIVLLDGKILDGRNRYAACKLADVEPHFIEWDGDGSPVAWVISQNLVRRHLTSSQRAVVALDLLPLLENEAKQRQRLSNGRSKKGAKSCATFSENGKASEIAARITKTNARYVETLKSMNRKMPQLLPRVRSGEITVQEAQRIALYETRKKSRKRSKARKNSNDAGRVTCGDCLDLIPTLKDCSVDLVLCSPPYAQQRNGHYRGVAESDYPMWTVKWMELIWDKLSDDGSVLIVIRPHLKGGEISDYVLRTRLALREDGWHENEELIWLKPDAPPLGSTKRLRRAWESILWFSKVANPYCNPTACGKETDKIGLLGPSKFGTGGDSPVHNGQNIVPTIGIARSSDVFTAPIAGVANGIQHPAMFPVSLAEQLILTFSRENDLVVDPFCGSGTTLVAAKRLNRDFRGFDQNRKYVKIAQDRLAEV